MANKRLLYFEDLVRLFEENKLTSFSSKESGYQLVVQIPSKFEKVDIEDADDGLLMRIRMRLFHVGQNRNQSAVTEEAAKKAMKHLAYKPILANFCETGEYDEDGNPILDFTSHDMIITDKGTEYIERQIGCITADEPWMEYDEELDKTFVCAYGAIPCEYSAAASIIERKGGTKMSVELLINEMEYSAKSKILELTDVMVLGETCLGINPETKEEVGEGMLGSRADIADFSKENNSIINYSKLDTDKLVETLERLNTTLSAFNNIKDSKESTETCRKEDAELEFEILTNAETVVETDSVVETEEVIEVETVVETHEETIEETVEETVETHEEVAEEVEPVEEAEEVSEEETPEVVEENSEESKESTEEFVEDVIVKPDHYSVVMSNGIEKVFELSLDDIQSALYNLVNDTYSEADNCWYCVTVYETHVVMMDWWTGRAFKQGFKREEDNFSLTGDRVEVFQNWLTKEEEKELAEMRANYSSLAQFKKDTEDAQLYAQKMEILNNEKYSVLAEKDEDNEYKNKGYAKLVSEVENYSLADLEKELKGVFADYITDGGHFAVKEEAKPEVSKKLFASPTKRKKSGRYGNLFPEKSE